MWQGTFSCGSSCLGCRATKHRYPGSKLVFRIGIYLRLWWLLSRCCFLIYLAVFLELPSCFLELPSCFLELPSCFLDVPSCFLDVPGAV